MFSAVERFELVDVNGVVLDNPGDSFDIWEPIGFSDFIHSIERGGINDSDEKSTTLGFTAEYGDSSTDLSFSGVKHPNSTSFDDPKTFLESIVDIDGSDAGVILNYYRTESGVENLKYQWSLVFQGSESIDDRFTCNIKVEYFGDKVRSRFESSVNIESNRDLDNSPRGSIDTLSIPFHSERITLSGSSEADGLELFTEPITNDHRSVVQVDFGVSDSDSELGQNLTQTFDQSYGDITDIYNTLIPSYRCPYDGVLEINVDTVLIWFITLPGGSFASYTYDVKFYLDIYNRNSLISSTQISSNTGSIAPINVHNWAGQVNYTGKFDVKQDYEIFIYAVNEYTNSLGSFSSTVNVERQNSSLSLIHETNVKPNVVDCVMIGDCLYETLTRTAGEVVGIDTSYFMKSGLFTLTTVSGTMSEGQIIIGSSSGAVGTIKEIDSSDYTISSISGYFEDGENVFTSTGNKTISVSNSAAYNYPYGSLNLVTTGRKIRNISGDIKVVPKDLIGFLINRYGAGWQLYKDSNDETKFKIDKAGEFFNETLITTLSSVETPAKRRLNRNLIFNKFESGYSKFAKENRDGSIRGFNTRSSRLTPFEKEKKTMSFISKVVTDGAEIERIKRLDLKNDESDQSDDELIIVKCQVYNVNNPFKTYFRITGEDKENVLGYSVEIGRTFVQTGGDTITLNGWYLKGQADDATTISVAGPTITQNDITIDSITFDADNNKTIIITKDELDIGNGNFRNARYFFFDKDIIIPETHQPFTNIQGVDDDSSVYNMDHTPLQSLIHWWNIIGGGLSVKNDSKEVLFLEGKNNTSFSKNYRSSDDSLTTSIQGENLDYALSALNNWNPPILTIYEWEIVSYMSYETWEQIRLSLLGQNNSDSSKNWGYIRFPDNLGNLVDIFPEQLKRNEKEGKTTIIGWELEAQDAPTTNYLLREDGTKFEHEDSDGYIERQI